MMAGYGKAPRVEDSLELETLDNNLFRCKPNILWRPIGSRGVFGGQIIGLSLVAATRTVPVSFKIHSLHSYFLLGGDNTRPILFHVTGMREARSFITKQVTANQNGQPIFVMLCSFMRGEEQHFVHQYVMPAAPDPESLPSREEMLSDWLTQAPKRHHESIKNLLSEPIPIDIRPVRTQTPREHVYPPRQFPYRLIWMKAKTPLPVNPALHMCVAAYSSDHQLIWTAVSPHGATAWTNPSLSMILSLDHSMWFHSGFQADKWMLYEMESPRTSGNRGVALGRLWTRDGTLAVSCAQEGLLRARWSPDKPITIAAETRLMLADSDRPTTSTAVQTTTTKEDSEGRDKVLHARSRMTPSRSPPNSEVSVSTGGPAFARAIVISPSSVLAEAATRLQSSPTEDVPSAKSSKKPSSRTNMSKL